MSDNAPRRDRDRATTERDLLDAAWKLFERDGLLAGLNLNDVANLAGANRALIYHYFDSRQGLLRAAARKRLGELQPLWDEDRRLPFIERRLHGFDVACGEPTLARIIALLALEGVEDTDLVGDIETTRQTLQGDVDSGRLPEDADLDLVHVLPLCTYLGYALLREELSAGLGVELDELDRRARSVFEGMLHGLTVETPAEPDREKP